MYRLHDVSMYFRKTAWFLLKTAAVKKPQNQFTIVIIYLHNAIYVFF